MKPIAFLIACLFLIVISTVACDTNTQQQSLSTPMSSTNTTVTHVVQDISATPTEPGINITREQYEQARATWSAQGIEEYEARVGYTAYSGFMGIWTLHVHVEGSDSHVLDYTRMPGLDAPTSGYIGTTTTEEEKNYNKEQLKLLTIEGNFHTIAQILDAREQHQSTTTVKFDKLLGNPTYVGSISATVSEPWSWSLASLRIIKQNKPTSTTP